MPFRRTAAMPPIQDAPPAGQAPARGMALQRRSNSIYGSQVIARNELSTHVPQTAALVEWRFSERSENRNPASRASACPWDGAAPPERRNLWQPSYCVEFLFGRSPKRQPAGTGRRSPCAFGAYRAGVEPLCNWSFANGCLSIQGDQRWKSSCIGTVKA